MSTTAHPPADLRDVVRTAALLRVSEFEVFRLAYQAWFGRLPREQELSQPFNGYLSTAVVPPWVRDFTRRVLIRWQEGCLDRRDYGLEDHPPATPTSMLIGVVSLLGLIAIVLLLVVGIVATRDPSLVCTLPPCY